MYMMPIELRNKMPIPDLVNNAIAKYASCAGIQKHSGRMGPTSILVHKEDLLSSTSVYS